MVHVAPSILLAVFLSLIIPTSPLNLNLQPQSASTRRRFLSNSIITPVIAAPFVAGSGVLADADTSPPPPLYKAWSAGDGFQDNTFISFSLDSYKSMVDDKSRTPAFKLAISSRLSLHPPLTQVVMDLGTGPFAILAIQAAKSGARKVYAVEAIAKAADLAKAAVKKAERKGEIPSGVIEVIEGLSTRIDLPEKVDLCVSEIVGSISSEEGLHASLRDAHLRHVKDPNSPSSFIPVRAQTLAAPASYTLHKAMGPPEYDWGKLSGEPVRFNCRDPALQIMADPMIAEDISFFSSPDFPPPGRYDPAGRRLEFKFEDVRLRANEESYYKELKRAGSPESEASELAGELSRSLSGFAFWPRLLLDPEGTIAVESRGRNGEARKSHWQTVLAITSDRPVEVNVGDGVGVDIVEILGKEVDEPIKYELKGATVKV
jgi:hypothetical protein